MRPWASAMRAGSMLSATIGPLLAKARVWRTCAAITGVRHGCHAGPSHASACPEAQSRRKLPKRGAAAVRAGAHRERNHGKIEGQAWPDGAGGRARDRSDAVRSRHVDHRDAGVARRRRDQGREPEGRRAGPQRLLGAPGCRQLLLHAAERQQALHHAQSQGSARQGDAAQADQEGRRLRRELRAGRHREARLLLRGGGEDQPAHHLRDGQGLRQGQPLRERTWPST